MRIRSIKPEFWRSDDIDALNWDTRLVFIGLWSYVDDNGVGLDKLASICADLFASDLERDPRETFARVSEAILTLAERGLIERYTVEGKTYLFIRGWSKHQRVDKPNKARYPAPSALTSGDGEPPEPLAKSSRESPETLAPGTEEQRNRGTERKTSSSAAPPTPTPPREDVEALCERLRDLVIENGSKAKITDTWRREARLMLDRDERDFEKALRLIEWCQADPFWRPNVLSMPKFRAKYDQLRLKANEQHATKPSRAAQKFANAEALKHNPNPDILGVFAGKSLSPAAPELLALPGGVA